MTNAECIEKFYTAFSDGDFREMTDCYHDDIIFQDPAFGELRGPRAKKMWEMLLSRNSKSIQISFEHVQADDETGSAFWTAEYVFSKTHRKVINRIHARFRFKDGKIIEHTDTFNLWKWTRQALGLTGYLLGWTPFMKKKIQKMTNDQLNTFMRRS